MMASCGGAIACCEYAQRTPRSSVRVPAAAASRRFQDNGLHSLDDLSGIGVEALSDELIQMGITTITLHANKMAKELIKAQPS